MPVKLLGNLWLIGNVRVDKGEGLIAASVGGQVEAIQYLLKNGVSVDDRSCAEAMYRASEGRHFEVVKCLVDHGVIKKNKRAHWRPLRAAVLNGDLEIVKLLVENGVDIFETGGPLGFGFLHYAAFAGRLDIVKYLVEKRCDIDKHSYDVRALPWRTPLHLASANNHFEVVKFLIACGAKLDSRDEFERTPLHHAAIKGYLEICKYLVLNGAKTEVRTRKKYYMYDDMHYREEDYDKTPLDIAAKTIAEDLKDFCKRLIPYRDQFPKKQMEQLNKKQLTDVTFVFDEIL